MFSSSYQRSLFSRLVRWRLHPSLRISSRPVRHRIRRVWLLIRGTEGVETLTLDANPTYLVQNHRLLFLVTPVIFDFRIHSLSSHEFRVVHASALDPA